MPLLKNRDQIEKMRESGRIVARTLRLVSEEIVPGKSTPLMLNDLADRLIREEGGVPSFLNYRGFPKSICVSVNDSVVHGIPNSVVIQEGDIVSLDFGVVKDGWHADGAWTYAIGEVSSDAKRLLNVTREALYQGIAKARAGNRSGDIGHAVESYCKRAGYGVVHQLVGHGIGETVHEAPEQVPMFGKPKTGFALKEGMTMCIEPMINQGSGEVVFDKDDEWTVRTIDGKLSAHFEHTIAITRGAPEILTLEEPAT